MDKMIYEPALIVMCALLCALLVIVVNRLGLWRNMLVCAVGGFVFVIMFTTASPLPTFAQGFLFAILTAALVWLGKVDGEPRPLLDTNTPLDKTE